MAGESLIGNLAVLLTMETAAFEKGASHASKMLRRTQREFEQLGKKLSDVGREMSTKITLPIVGAGAAIIKMAGDFETSMNEVGISTQASADEMGKMRDLALQIGKDTTKSASEAAGAMDTLAKAGMKTADILNGGAKAAVALAEAAGSELEPAAAVITDTMTQFNKTTKDLPAIINNVTGAVNESKFSFEDFALGLAQGGGVAASAGVEFEDFAAALAATSSQFNSGQDAGTSMKTFLLSLTPATKKARAAFEEAGFSAYNANGTLKSMAEIAGDLATKFGHLSEEDLNATFKQMFGTDAIRTAIGLMKQGEAGITAMQERIAATDASAQAAARMKGFNAELEKLKGAIETAAIAIADSGMLAALTSLVSGFANVIDKLGELSPETLKWITIIAGVAAVVGPVVMVVGSMVSGFAAMLPLLVKLGPLFTGIAGVLKLVGAAALIASRFLIAGLLAHPVLAGAALLIGGIYLAWKHWDKIGPIVQRLYTAVKTYLMDKMNAVFSWIGGKLKWVGDQFAKLYDRVVGNSYVPDMVDGIQAEMARLDAVMVKPVTAATSKAGEAFLALQQRVQGLLAQLFPEQAKQLQFNKDLADLTAYADKAKWSVDQLSEAIKRLRSQTFNLQDTPLGVTQFDTSAPDRMEIDYDEVHRLADSTMPKLVDQSERWRDVMADVGANLAGMVGDWLSRFVEGTAKLKDLWKSLLAFGIQFLTSPNGLASIIGGARADGGPVMAGTPYLVGERGPELFMPGKSGQIISNENTRAMMGGRSDVSVNVYGVQDVGGFNRNQTQIARAARRRLGV